MRQLQLSDGRVLDLWVSGSDDDPVLVFHTGTPGSGAPFRDLERAATRHRLRLLSYSRPGSGGSTRQPGRTVADVAPDLIAVLDELGVELCLTAGWSGGGPHALAMGALLPERVAGVLTIASVAPYDGEGLDFMAGMGADNVEEFGAALAGEEPLRQMLEQIAPALRDTDAAGIVASLAGLLPEVDRAQLTNEFGEDLAANLREALRLGVDGWLDDDLAFVSPWGFEVGAIAVPTFVWQGDLDLMVPFAHGEWLAAHIPEAVAHLLDGEGHLSLGLGAIDEMLTELRSTLD